MDVTLHKRCAKFVYVIPEGLRELMSDISREVIRSQPEHIYTFIADYLDALMITRENARVAARLVESIIRIATMTVELLQQTGMTREEADRMANIIQDAFKRYMTLRHDVIPYSSKQEEEEEEHNMIINIINQYGDLYDQQSSAILIIQKAFREFKDRHAKERELLAGMIDWRVAARSTLYLYRKTGVSMQEANRAATLIKAAYKGYYTRRIMKRLVEEGQHIYEESGEDVDETFESREEDDLGREFLGEGPSDIFKKPSELVATPSGIAAASVMKHVLEQAVPGDEDMPGEVTLRPEKIEEQQQGVVEHPETPPPTEATDHVTETIYEVTEVTEQLFPEDQDWGEETGLQELPLDEPQAISEPPPAEGYEGHEGGDETEAEHSELQAEDYEAQAEGYETPTEGEQTTVTEPISEGIMGEEMEGHLDLKDEGG